MQIFVNVGRLLEGFFFKMKVNMLKKKEKKEGTSPPSVDSPPSPDGVDVIKV